MEHGQRLLAAQYRLAQHYLDKLRAAQRIYSQGNESAVDALTMFDREREQVEHYQAWASAHMRHDVKATALCSEYVRASPDILKSRLLSQEYFAWLETALEAARLLGDRRAEAAHLLEMCETSGNISQDPRAFDYAQQALEIARQINDQQLVAQALNTCGEAIRYQESLRKLRHTVSRVLPCIKQPAIWEGWQRY